MTTAPTAVAVVPPAALSVATTGYIAGVVVPPVSDLPVQVTAEVRTQSGDLLGTLDSTALQGELTWVLNGVGEARVSWAPSGGPLIADGQMVDWWDADVELWVYRQGELVWQGPIVAHSHTPRTSRVESRAWTREGYLQRLILGDAERVNLFTPGYFDAGLTGWAGFLSADAVTSPLYREDRSMRVVGVGAISAVSSLLAETYRGVVTATVVGRYQGTQWADEDGGTEGAPVMATLVHSSTAPGGGDVQIHGSYPVAVEGAPSPGAWLRGTVKAPRLPARVNTYTVTVHGTGDTAWIGEVEVVQAENVSARAGQDYGLFAASLFSDVVDVLNETHPGWVRDNAPVGVTLADNLRADKADHPDIRSLLSDLEVYGDWWVRPGTRTIAYRARRGQRVAGLSFDAATIAELTVDRDSTAASTQVIALADGMDGPTREEGSAYLDEPLPGARLMSCEVARRGLPARDLEMWAAQTLAAEGRPRTTLNGSPAEGPLTAGPSPVRGLLGGWVHLLQPGDSVLVHIVDGALDYTLEPRVTEMAWDPVTDRVSITWGEQL